MTQNRLHTEKSPYLLQHKDNPVNWYPWGEEAFKAAASQNKLIFLSIGYSTCHWCHVMERESFENPRIAKILNDNFISIKVDREERPDVDAIYMKAVQLMTGQGGWPMSVFLTPNRAPIFGGTYFPSETFESVMMQLASAWKNEGSKIELFAKEMTQTLATERENRGAELSLDDKIFDQVANSFTQSFDPEYGGFGGAPKFPPSVALQLLLRIYCRNKNKKILEMVDVTLQGMVKGGIYDHLGGGFSRYSTDSSWTVPHFEKMLYDNALLSKTFLEAFQVTGNKTYLQIADDIFNYIEDEMTDPAGGFFAGQDADSEDEEGKYYIWTVEELKEALTDIEFKRAQQLYRINNNGNFEDGKIILTLNDFNGWHLKEEANFQAIRSKLHEARRYRIAPLKDKKIIAEWNGLMVDALATGYRITGNREYLTSAQNAARFILRSMWNGQVLSRRYCDGEVRFDGVLDDYVFMIAGLLSLYQATQDTEWKDAALQLQKAQDEIFADERGGGYFYSSDIDIIPTKEFYDNALPSGNGIAISNLLKLSVLTRNNHFIDKAKSILCSVQEKFPHYSSGLCSYLIALDLLLGGGREMDPQKIFPICSGSFCAE